MKHILCVCFLGMSFFTAVGAGENGIDAVGTSRLEGLAPGDTVPVLVSFRAPVDCRRFRPAQRKQAAALIAELKSKSARNTERIQSLLQTLPPGRVRPLWIANAIALEADWVLIQKLAQHPAVISVRRDEVVAFHGSPFSPLTVSVSPNPMEAIGVVSLWNLGITGIGVVVANMDTGVDLNHPDLASRWRGGENSWKDVHNEYSEPFDYNGHGTGTMGLILGGDSDGSFLGVAPDAKWIAVKIFNDFGKTTYSKIHEAFQWLLDPDDDPNTPDAPDIVNNSWGLATQINQCIPEFYDDVQVLRAAGILVIFSSGNVGPALATSISPANYDIGLSIGAVDDANEVAIFSSRGPSACTGGLFPSLVAPGVNLKTADLTGGGAFPHSYTSGTGTSYAASLVSGSLALLVSALPDMEPALLEEALLLSAHDRGDPGPDNDYGYGLINSYDAYQYLLQNLCPSDSNRDGHVDIQDLSILSSQWIDCQSVECTADLTGDGIVDLQDFARFSREFLNLPGSCN